MGWKQEGKAFAALAAVFLACFFLPAGVPRFDRSVGEALALARDYAREHVLLCLVPAFLIAGAIGVFVRQASVMKYLGARAPKPLAYAVASVSGSILAVCSCTVLPLFAGIWRMGAGLGPACAFLYAGPAINVLAIILTARVLGLELGIARAAGAIGFSFVIGLSMHVLFRKEELARAEAQVGEPAPDVPRRLWKDALFFAGLVGFLVFANFAKPEGEGGAWGALYAAKWPIAGASALLATVALAAWFSREEASDWLEASWGFAKQILPLLFFGVLAAGFLLGRPGHEALIPGRWIESLVGEKPEACLSLTGLAGSAAEPFVRAIWPFWTCLFASVFGAVMYFATLTEVPILQGLMGSGMAKGPALSLLLAGPAVSLPSILVLRGIMGTKKTLAFVSLVVVLSAAAGWLYGLLFGGGNP